MSADPIALVNTTPSSPAVSPKEVKGKGYIALAEVGFAIAILGAAGTYLAAFQYASTLKNLHRYTFVAALAAGGTATVGGLGMVVAGVTKAVKTNKAPPAEAEADAADDADPADGAAELAARAPTVRADLEKRIAEAKSKMSRSEIEFREEAQRFTGIPNLMFVNLPLVLKAIAIKIKLEVSSSNLGQAQEMLRKARREDIITDEDIKNAGLPPLSS